MSRLGGDEVSSGQCRTQYLWHSAELQRTRGWRTHFSKVVATDGLGNTASATYSWTVVGEPENTGETLITGPTKRGYVGNAKTLTCNPGAWSGGEEDEYSYQWYEDESSIASATSQTFVTGPAENGKVLTCKVTVKNLGGEVVSTSLNNVRVETEAPKVSLTTKPPAHTTSTSAELGFTAELGFSVVVIPGVVRAQPCDTVTGSVTPSIDCCPSAIHGAVVPAGAPCAAPSLTVECRLDSAALAACTSPQNYSGLAIGEHTFEVVATDFLGNKASATYSVGRGKACGSAQGSSEGRKAADLRTRTPMKPPNLAGLRWYMKKRTVGALPLNAR